MLVIGSFHVAHDGGTRQKLRSRRPNDTILTIIYRDDPTLYDAW